MQNDHRWYTLCPHSRNGDIVRYGTDRGNYQDSSSYHRCEINQVRTPVRYGQLGYIQLTLNEIRQEIPELQFPQDRSIYKLRIDKNFTVRIEKR